MYRPSRPDIQTEFGRYSLVAMHFSAELLDPLLRNLWSACQKARLDVCVRDIDQSAQCSDIEVVARPHFHVAHPLATACDS